MNLYVHTIIAVMVMCTLRVDAQRVVVDPAIADASSGCRAEAGCRADQGKL